VKLPSIWKPITPELKQNKNPVERFPYRIDLVINIG